MPHRDRRHRRDYSAGVRLCVCVCKVLAAQVSVEQGEQAEGERERRREYHGKLQFSSARRLEICSQVVDRVA